MAFIKRLVFLLLTAILLVSCANRNIGKIQSYVVYHPDTQAVFSATSTLFYT